MTSIPSYDTMSLLNTSVDGIYILLHTIFRLLKPIRRKYKLSINSIIVLNGIFLYHKFKGSIFTANAIRVFIGYYDKPKIDWYFDLLCSRGHIVRSDVIKGIQYYKITESGINVMNDFSGTYQEILHKWYSDKGIVL